jgi:hypothetical protein
MFLSFANSTSLLMITPSSGILISMFSATFECLQWQSNLRLCSSMNSLSHFESQTPSPRVYLVASSLPSFPQHQASLQHESKYGKSDPYLEVHYQVIDYNSYPNFSIVDRRPLTWSHMMATISYTGMIDSSLINVSAYAKLLSDYSYPYLSVGFITAF